MKPKTMPVVQGLRKALLFSLPIAVSGVSAAADFPETITPIYTDQDFALSTATTQRAKQIPLSGNSRHQAVADLIRGFSDGAPGAATVSVPRQTASSHVQNARQVSSKITADASLSYKSTTPIRVQVKTGYAGAVARLRGLDAQAPLSAAVARSGKLSARARVDSNASRFLNDYARVLKLDSPAQEMQLQRLYEDDQGETHARYGQRYQNLPVWGGAAHRAPQHAG